MVLPLIRLDPNTGKPMLREINSTKSSRERVFIGSRALAGKEILEGPTYIIASVMHSGTHFVMWEIFKGWTDLSSIAAGKRGYVVRHLENVAIQEIRGLAKNWPVIIPMRNPFSIAQSWKNRKKSIDHCLQMLSNAVAMQDVEPYYLPIDNPARGKFLEVIRQEQELDLKTDWPVLKYDNEGKFFTPLAQSEVDLVRGFWDTHIEFFQGLGYRE